MIPRTLYKPLIKPLATTLLLVTTALPVSAQDSTDLQSAFLTLAIGYYDVLDDQDGVDFRAEYRSGSVVLIDNLKPWAGLEVTSQGSLWAGGGFLYDWNFAPQWHFTPSIGAGLYTDGGSDIDLDYPIQFRSQLEVSYEFETTGSRIGAGLSHMSNAGLGNSNPGTEVFSLNWQIPF